MTIFDTNQRFSYGKAICQSSLRLSKLKLVSTRSQPTHDQAANLTFELTCKLLYGTNIHYVSVTQYVAMI